MPKRPSKSKPLATKTEDREKIAIWLDNDQLKALREIQQTDGVPVVVSIRKAIDAYLEAKAK